MSTPVMQNRHQRRVFPFVVSVLLLVTLLVLMVLNTLRVAARQERVAADFGYGFNVAAWDVALIQSMGFNWMKVFNGPGSRQPVSVLVRVDANASHLGNLSGFGDNLFQLAQQQKGFVEAYEIGNEPNLDASYGWTVSPNAVDYATLLCEAYGRIKAADSQAKVISAGLAPTGRVQGNWNGHPGHAGGYQDEREFFKEFLAAGGGNCLDGAGYHPYGFGADYDAEPDVPSADPTRNCVNGFCFRGVEKLFELMQANGLGHKKVWATEFGWIVQPPQACLSDPSWQGRLWQIVSEQKQSTNLVGAFEYAAANWPWMEAMFIFNLNFNTTAGLPECEQMRYYGVQGRPAESALQAMPKATDPPVAQLAVSHSSVATIITAGQQPFSRTVPITLRNVGTLTFTFTATVQSGTLTPTITQAAGTLAPMASITTNVQLMSTSFTTGTYTATVLIEASPGTVGSPISIPVILYVVDEIHNAYLPMIPRRE